MKLITVVIPTFNRNKLLFETLNGLKKQSIKPDEILVINNGNEKVDFKIDGLDFKVIDIMYKAGASQARNFGAILANSQYIAFLDDDDFWENDYILKIKETINKYEPDVIFSRLDKLENNEIKPFRKLKEDLQYTDFLTTNPGVTGSSIVVKKEFFLTTPGFDPKLITSNDKDFVIQLLLKNPKVSVCNDIQAIFNIHDGERLSDIHKMKLGRKMFYEKYKVYMNTKQRYDFLSKIYKYKYLSEKTICSFIAYRFYKIVRNFI